MERSCLVLTAGWSQCTPRGQSWDTIQYTVANVCCFGRKPKEFVFFRRFTSSWPPCPSFFCPFEPDLLLRFNSCNNITYYSPAIIHSATSSVAFSKKRSERSGTKCTALPGQIIDFTPGTQWAHLLGIHNCRHCTPQELDPTHASL